MKLRKYQAESVKNILATSMGIVSVATGGGKSIIMTSAINEQEGKVLVIAHTKALVSQLAETIKNNSNKSVSLFYGENHESLDADVVVATWQTLAIKNLDKDMFDHIHVDECHNARGKKYRQTIQRFNYKTIHGYTATFNGSGEYELNMLFGDVIIEVGLFDLIDMGFLSKMNIMINVGAIGSKSYNKQKFEVIKQTLSSHSHIDKTLHFYNRNKRFNEVDEWTLLDPKSYAKISAKVKSNKREEIFSNFRDENSGLNNLLCNRILNEGIDLPITNSLVFHETVGDFRTVMQRFGRGLRVWNSEDITTKIFMFVDENCKSQVNAVRSLYQEVEHEAKKRGITSIVKNGSTKEVEALKDSPIVINLIDKTDEIVNKLSKKDDYTLEEFVALMRKEGINNHSSYTNNIDKFNFVKIPENKFNMTMAELWSAVRDDKKVKVYYTLDEFVSLMRKENISNSKNYTDVWKKYNFTSIPHRYFKLTSKELWSMVRGDDKKVYYTLDEFVSLMKRDGITGSRAYSKECKKYGFVSIPHRYFKLTSKELWSMVRV